MKQMMENRLENCEQVSALADGQLDAGQLNFALQNLANDGDLRADWNAYHVIGEVLRNGERAATGASPAFVNRLMARVQAEQAHLPQATPVAPVAAQRSAANQPVFRWKMVAGFASLTAVAAIGWSVFASLGGAPSGAAQMATAGSPVLVSGDGTPAMIRDARLDELLAAHKQAGGVSALQMPAGFLRNATFEGNER